VLSNGLAKRRDGLEVNITTAGYEKESLLGRMYDYGKAVQSGEIKDDAFLFDWTEASLEWDLSDEKQLEVAIREANPHVDLFGLVEQTKAKFHEIPEFEFRRYFLNQWVEADEAWLPLGAWDACFDADARIPDDAEVILGVDIGTKKDTSAVARLWRREDDRVVVEVEVFTPRGDGTAIELAVVEAAIDRNAIKYDVRGVVYDRWAFERSAQDLSDRGLVMIEVPMSPERMTVASQGMYEAIISREIAHNGDPVLAAHVRAGATKPHERGWRLVKGKSRRPIDALIAMTLAYSQVRVREAPFVFEAF
jgi:phage terminase large subunit-like protein